MQHNHRVLLCFGLVATTIALCATSPLCAGQTQAVHDIQPCGCVGPRHQQALDDFRAGNQLAANGNPSAVDEFFSAARLTWQDLTDGLRAEPPRLMIRSLTLHNSAVHALVVVGHQLGRFDVTSGLQVLHDGVSIRIPVVSVGMAWQLNEIGCFRGANEQPLSCQLAKHNRHGIGAPILGIRFRRDSCPSDRRYLKKHPIAMTALLRLGNDESKKESWRLDLCNPIKQQTITVQDVELTLSRNVGSAVAYAMDELTADVDPWSSFFDPQIAVSHEGLLTLQPYQPGKIPLVLVHGLLSNPSTWGTIINELLNDSELMERYQIWVFLYPTSLPFLSSATKLRKELRSTIETLNSNKTDRALENVILIGHSMGGILSRFQIASSGNILWNQFVKIPISDIQASSSVRQKLYEMFFFEPQPFIKRVVFIAVPHRGSALSSRLAGCVGRLLAGQLPASEQEWRDLRKQNPHVFQRGVPRRLPSSVAGLAPRSPGLRGMAKLPLSPQVQWHSIIGTHNCKPFVTSDSVVAVKSARIAGAQSELYVDATHTSIKEHPQTIAEVKRILWQHWHAHDEAIQAPLEIQAPSEWNFLPPAPQ